MKALHIFATRFVKLGNMNGMIEHRLFAMSPFLRKGMMHKSLVRVLPIADWHNQTGNQIEIPY